MAAVPVPVARVVLAAIAVIVEPLVVATAARPAAVSAIVRRAKIAARAWVTLPSVHSAKLSSVPTWRCASSRRRPMAKR